MSLAGLSIIAASVLAIVTLLPQIVRIQRTGEVAGLAMTWPVLAAVTTGGWTWYVLHQGLWESAWSCGAMVVVYSVIGAQLAFRGVPWRRAARWGATWVSALAALAVVDGIAGSSALGVALAFSYVVQAGPAVWAAWRDPAPAGISVASWSLFLVEVSLWAVYGLANADVPIVMFAVLGSLTSLAMLVRRWLTRDAVAAAMSRRAAAGPPVPAEARLRQ